MPAYIRCRCVVDGECACHRGCGCDPGGMHAHNATGLNGLIADGVLGGPPFHECGECGGWFTGPHACWGDHLGRRP